MHQAEKQTPQKAATEKTLSALYKAALAPSATFTRAARYFARRHGLDEEAVLRCQPFAVGGVPFELLQHGARDTEGATVLLDYGQLEIDDAPARTKMYHRLLEHNSATPAALHGFFGRLPDGRIRYCVRTGLDRTASDDTPNGIDRIVDTAAAMYRANLSAVSRYIQSTMAPTAAQGN